MRIDPRTINYLDEPLDEWERSLDATAKMADLRELGERFASLFPDAAEAIAKMDGEDFDVFKAGLRKERKGLFSGEEWMGKWGAIPMPELAIHVGIIANKFHVPFGLAFCRMRDAGSIKINRAGVAFVPRAGDANG